MKTPGQARDLSGRGLCGVVQLGRQHGQGRLSGTRGRINQHSVDLIAAPQQSRRHGDVGDDLPACEFGARGHRRQVPPGRIKLACGFRSGQ